MAALEESLYSPRLMTKKRTAPRKKKALSSRTVLGAISKIIGLCLVAAWLRRKSGGPSDSGALKAITGSYSALTQEGLPNAAMLTEQRTVTQYLMAVSSNTTPELTPKNRTVKPTNSVPASSDDELPRTSKEPTPPIMRKKTSSLALIPHAPISEAIGGLFKHLVTWARRRLHKSAV
jgi:hypothetical protein